MYKHVLVAVDLSEESPVLLKKAVGIAKRHDAKLSIIHVDVNFSDLYTGLIDVNMSSMQDRISTETQLSNFRKIEWQRRFRTSFK